MGIEQGKGRPQNEDSRAFRAEMFKRMPVYGNLAASIPAEAPGSVEWLGRVGKFWWKAREQQGLTRQRTAQQMGVGVSALRFLEVGLGYPELGIVNPDGEINPNAAADSDIVKNYAQALGQPQLYEDFCKTFNLAPTPPTEPK